MPILAGLMSTYIQHIPHTATIREAARMMRDFRVGALLVHENGEAAGILTERDLVWKLLAEPVNPDLEHVATYMSSPIITMDANTSPEQAELMMAERRIRHVAVTHKDKIVGIVSLRDILLYYKNKSEQFALE